MASNFFFPSLNEDGWVKDTVKVADYLLSCFFAADKSQSYLYEQNISSLPWIIQETAEDMTRTLSLTKETLYSMFSRYFNDVLVEVVEVDNPTSPSQAIIKISLQFKDTTNKIFDIAKILTIANLKINNIISVNNTGNLL